MILDDNNFINYDLKKFYIFLDYSIRSIEILFYIKKKIKKKIIFLEESELNNFFNNNILFYKKCLICINLVDDYINFFKRNNDILNFFYLNNFYIVIFLNKKFDYKLFFNFKNILKNNFVIVKFNKLNNKDFEKWVDQFFLFNNIKLNKFSLLYIITLFDFCLTDIICFTNSYFYLKCNENKFFLYEFLLNINFKKNLSKKFFKNLYLKKINFSLYIYKNFSLYMKNNFYILKELNIFLYKNNTKINYLKKNLINFIFIISDIIIKNNNNNNDNNSILIFHVMIFFLTENNFIKKGNYIDKFNIKYFT